MIQYLENKYFKIALAFIFVFVLSYNFYVAHGLKFGAGGDAADYVSLGLSLAKKQKYGRLIVPGGSIQAFKENEISKNQYAFGGHSTWRPPVWPFLIAGIFLIFGYNLVYILIFKYLLHLLGMFIFYKSLKILNFREAIIIMGTFLYGVSPAWQIYSRVFLSEPITLFFITLWIYLLLRFIYKKSGFLPQAIVGGLLILTHPYFIFLPFSVWFILSLNKQIKVNLALISTMVCIAVVSIWVTRNFIVLDTSHLIITTSTGAVLAKGWNKDVPEKHTNTKGDLADETLVLENFEYDDSKGYNEIERMELYKNATLHFVKTNPELILPIIGKKLLSAFNPFPETPKPGILETGRVLFQVFSLLALFYILFFSKFKLIQSLAIGLILSTIAITIFTFSGFRFRMPQVGLELLFIIFTIESLLNTKKIITK